MVAGATMTARIWNCALPSDLPTFPSETRSPQHLPHEIPSWVDPQKDIYFVTINCAERGRNQRGRPDIAEKLFETVRHRQEQFLW